DVPLNLNQAVHVGFLQNGVTRSGRLTYECIPQHTVSICRPSCMNEKNSREGVVGDSILWTFQRTKENGWTRIYDVVITGRLFQQPVSLEDKAADITYLKPYFNRALGVDYEREQCAEPVWKLTDSSEANSQMPPVSKFHRNVTVYFDQSYSIAKVSLIASEMDNGNEECVIRFGGRKSVTKIFSLKSDCTMENETIGLYVCSTPDLMGYPFTNATIDAKGLFPNAVLQKCGYYPSVKIVPFTKAIDPQSTEDLKIQCVASTCPEKHSNSNCDQYGHIVQCAYLELARTHEPSNGHAIPDTVLVTNGRVKPEVAEVITELKIVHSSKTELVTTVPRTHSYYGQYKCRCQTDDPFTSVVESVETKLPATEFDQDLVFERSFTAKLDEQEIPNTLGFLEMPEITGYFTLIISGHSLTENLQLRVTYLDSGEFTTITEEYAQTSSVQAFPLAKGTLYAWPIRAYRIVQENAWPDVTDEGLTTIEWETKDEAVTVRKVKDELRTIVISPQRQNTVRAWVWRRDSHVVDIRAHYQNEPHNSREKKLYLQRVSCSTGENPEQVSSVTISGDECKRIVRQGEVECERTKGGFAVQFTVTNPSASDSYHLYEVMEDQESDRELAKSTSVVQGLQAELDATDIRIKLAGIKAESEPGRTQMVVVFTIHSKLITDNSACHPTFVKLQPSWPVSEKLEQQLGSNQTQFTVDVPNDQQLLTFDLEVRIEGGDASGSDITTKRTLQLLNPRHLKLDLKLDTQEETVTWTSLPESITEVLDKFNVKMWSTNKVCGIREEQTPPRVDRPIETPINVSFVENLMAYRISLIDVPNFKSRVLVDHEIEVTPIFKTIDGESIKGVPSNVAISKGKIGQSGVKWDKSAANRTARIYVIPSQPALCLRDNPAITVKLALLMMGPGTATPNQLVDGFHLEAEEGGLGSDFGKWYTIKELQPGRRYEVKATVLYPTGIQDERSAAEVFWTSDEVFVSSSEVSVKPGDRLEIQCTGAVGPNDSLKKRLEWKRADGSQLPDGTRIETVTATESDPKNMETVKLVFEEVEAGQANTYACFIKPSVASQVGVQYVPPTVRVVVNVLELDIQSHVANVADPITVQCRAHQGSTLTWTSPGGAVVRKDRQREEPYVTDVKNEQGTISLLHIPRVKLAQTGQYLCKQDGTDNHRAFKLKMQEDVRIVVDEDSSQLAGETFSITCNALLGHADQKVEWYRREGDGHPWTPVSYASLEDESIKITNQNAELSNGDNVRSSQLRMINSPASAGEFACALKSMSGDSKQFARETMELPKTSASVHLDSIPVIKLDRARRVSRQQVVVKCTGFPAHEEDHLEWYYVSSTGNLEIPIGKRDDKEEPDNQELVQLLQATMRITDSTPASWPGLSSPVLLAASRRIAARNAEILVFTPEVLELTVTNATETGIDPRLIDGSISCRYRRPRAVMKIKEGKLLTQEVTPSYIEKLIQINQLLGSDYPSEEGIVAAVLQESDENNAMRFGQKNSKWLPIILAFALIFLQIL
ncbi:immunoglobulin domain protein, partial [Opisthorchis viverrini]